MPDHRVVQLTGSSDGGVGRHARELSALLSEHNRVILAGPREVIAGADSRVRTTVIDVQDRPRMNDARALARIRAIARGADVLHAHGLRAGALAALALSTPTPERTALVVTLHNAAVGGQGVRSVAAGLLRVITARADVVLGVSGDLVTDALVHGARRAERALVPAPRREPAQALGETERRSLGLYPGWPMVLTVARLAPQKGLGLLADAAALLADRAPDARWLVAGNGPLMDDLADQVLGEALPVTLLGHRPDVPSLFAAADVVVSTSAWEGQPINLQEALAAGAPIVATDVGGTREVTGDAALLVPYADPDALAGAITRVLTDSMLADDLRQRSLRRAAELPTADDAAAQVLEIYADIAGG
ncbi:glycosyltransferase family 4 protein [Ruania halotolerans]|uniref:glycosyltransferase family 4 protein n=1 Tax=Ruania halotolerans TaxID=2897773 RepID=UPI001E3F882B|nr:glycosyltransferase family 4 protein [Ruania halotolerans]UFU05050.1 glycosyltransferase family 4 protein [Ruania halotolerans]